MCRAFDKTEFGRRKVFDFCDLPEHDILSRLKTTYASIKRTDPLVVRVAYDAARMRKVVQTPHVSDSERRALLAADGCRVDVEYLPNVRGDTAWTSAHPLATFNMDRDVATYLCRSDTLEVLPTDNMIHTHLTFAAKAYNVDYTALKVGHLDLCKAEALPLAGIDLARRMNVLYTTASLEQANLPQSPVFVQLRDNVLAIMAETVKQNVSLVADIVPKSKTEEYRGQRVVLQFRALHATVMRATHRYFHEVFKLAGIRNEYFVYKTDLLEDVMNTARMMACIVQYDRVGVPLIPHKEDVVRLCLPPDWPPPLSETLGEVSAEVVSMMEAIDEGILSHDWGAGFLIEYALNCGIVASEDSFYVLDKDTQLWRKADKKLPLDTQEKLFSFLLRTAELAGSIMQEQAEEAEKGKGAKVKGAVRDAQRRLGDMSWRDGVVKSLRCKVCVPGTDQSFDTHKNLFVFSCGTCLDLDGARITRKVRAEERVLTTTGYQYPIEVIKEDIQQVRDWLFSMFERKDEAHALLCALAYQLFGVNYMELILVMMGSTANGKSTIADASAKAFGDYFTVWDPSAVTKKGAAGVADPNLLASVGKRFIVISEPTSKSGELDTELLKSLSGGDAQNKRALFSNSMQLIKLDAAFCFLANKFSLSATASPSTERRTWLIDFPFRFTPRPSLPNDRPCDMTLKSRVASVPFRNAFIHVLIDCWYKSVQGRTELPRPARWLSAADARAAEANPALAWFERTYEHGLDASDRIPVKSVYDSWMCSDECIRRGWRGQQEKFERELAALGLTSKRVGGKLAWTGVRLREAVEEAETAAWDAEPMEEAEPEPEPVPVPAPAGTKRRREEEQEEEEPEEEEEQQDDWYGYCGEDAEEEEYAASAAPSVRLPSRAAGEPCVYDERGEYKIDW